MKKQHYVLIGVSFVLVASLIVAGIFLFRANTHYRLARFEITIGESTHSISRTSHASMLQELDVLLQDANELNTPAQWIAFYESHGISLNQVQLEPMNDALGVAYEIYSMHIEYMSIDEGELFIRFDHAKLEYQHALTLAIEFELNQNNVMEFNLPSTDELAEKPVILRNFFDKLFYGGFTWIYNNEITLRYFALPETGALSVIAPSPIFVLEVVFSR